MDQTELKRALATRQTGLLYSQVAGRTADHLRSIRMQNGLDTPHCLVLPGSERNCEFRLYCNLWEKFSPPPTRRRWLQCLHTKILLLIFLKT